MVAKLENVAKGIHQNLTDRNGVILGLHRALPFVCCTLRSESALWASNVLLQTKEFDWGIPKTLAADVKLQGDCRRRHVGKR